MKSLSRKRRNQAFNHAEAVVDARNKAFNIVMAVLLVFTMLPVTVFTYESQASAEPLNNEQVNAYSEEGSTNQGGNSAPDGWPGSGSSENGTGGCFGL